MTEQLDKLIPALIKAQGELKHASKDSSNPHFKSKYADLATVLDTCKPVLQANGFAITHQRESTETGEYLITTLWHSSGQNLKSRSKLMPTKQDPQGFGSAVTYARRYDLSALIGLASDDDDGNAASAPAPKPKIFATSALRNAFIKNVEDAFDKAATLDELSTLMEIYKAKFDDMKASDNEYDRMAIESLRQFYLVVRKRLENPPEIPEDIRAMDEAFKDKIWEP